MKRSIAVALTALCTLYGLTVFAAEQTGKQEDVTAETKPAADKPAKAAQEAAFSEIVVTGTKTETALQDLPVSVQVVDRKEIKTQPDYAISNIGELIRDLPGVHVAQYFPWGPPWVHLRGTGYFIGRTAYLIDGVPISPFMATVVNNQDVERVEVLLGPSSALYGPNAIGGVINIITRQGKKDTGAYTEIGYGSRNSWRPHAEAGTQAGDFHVYASYTGDYSDGYRMNPYDVVYDLYKRGKPQWLNYASLDPNEYDNTHLAVKLGWDNKKGTGFWFAYYHQMEYLYGGRQNRILLDDINQGLGTFRFYTNVTDFMKLTLSAGYQHLDRPGQENRGATVSGGVVTWNDTPSTRSGWENKRYPLDLQADIAWMKNNKLTLGATFVREKEYRNVMNAATGATTSKTEYTTDQTGFYAQNETFLLNDRLILLAGLRYDKWKYDDIFDLLSTPKERPSVSKDTMSYRGGAKYKVNENIAVRAAAGTGFWPGLPVWFFQNTQSGTSWREANPGLQPEKSWMVDFGIEFSYPKTGTYATVTPYYGEITDVVSYRYDAHPTQPGVSIIRTQNLGGATMIGVETRIDQVITKELTGFASLTLNRSRIVDDPVNRGHQLRNAPDYWGSAGLTYRNPSVVNGRAAVRFSGSRFYDDENTNLPYYRMRPYITADLKIWRDWRIGPGTLTAAVSADNIFDKTYETEIVYMHPGRSIFATVGYRVPL